MKGKGGHVSVSEKLVLLSVGALSVLSEDELDDVPNPLCGVYIRVRPNSSHSCVALLAVGFEGIDPPGS